MQKLYVSEITLKDMGKNAKSKTRTKHGKINCVVLLEF